jgi:hypothetical protein
MKVRIETAVTWLLYLFAFAWPWGVYTYVPVVGLLLPVLVATAVVILAGAHAILNRRPRIPFEIAWPLALLCAVLWYDAARTGVDWPISETGWVLFGAAIVQLKLSRPAILQCLRLSATAGGCVAALSLLSRAGFLVPTAFSIHFDRATAPIGRLTGYPFFAFAPGVADAILMLTVCTAIAAYFAVAGRGNLAVRTRSLLDAGLCVVAVVLTIPWMAGHVDLWPRPDYGALSVSGWFAFGLTVWIFARIAAKSIVARQDDLAKGHGLFVAILGVVALFSLIVWPGGSLWLAFMLGTAVVYAHGKGEAPDLELGWRTAAIAPVLILAAIGLFHVNPSNPRDPRNVDYTLTPLFLNQDLHEVWHHLSAYEDIFGPDRRLYLWRARLALALGHPHWAAASFRRAYPADKADTPIVLPPPTETDGEAFLVNMRDYVSAAGDRRLTFAQDRALIALGRGSAALSSLEHQTRRYTDGEDRKGSVSLAEAIAWLLEDPKLVAPLSEWPNQRLIALLERWGARIESAPEIVPRNHLPMILIGHVATSDSRLYLSSPGSLYEDALEGSFPRTPERGAWEWVGWTAEPKDDSLTVRLHAQSDSDVEEAARIHIEYGGHAKYDHVGLGPGRTPDVPAIFVWLP